MRTVLLHFLTFCSGNWQRSSEYLYDSDRNQVISMEVGGLFHTGTMMMSHRVTPPGFGS